MTWRRLGWALTCSAAIGFTGTVFVSFFLRNGAFLLPPTVGAYGRAILVTHVISAGIALVAGPFQLSARIRIAHPGVHRALGRLYLLSVLVGGSSALPLAWTSDGGAAARAGFAVFSLLWLSTAWLAYRSILGGNTRVHRQWMYRNYALTFGAITIRAWLGLFAGALGLAFSSAFAAAVWLGWVVNLLAAEWILRGGDSTLAPRGRAGPLPERLDSNP